MKLREIAIEITSLILGAETASHAGDPSAGYAIGEFLNNRLHSLVHRFTSQRQAKRITEVSAYALNAIRHRLENGETQLPKIQFSNPIPINTVPSW